MMRLFLGIFAVWIQWRESHAFSPGHHKSALVTRQPSRSALFVPSRRLVRPLLMATIPDLDSNDPFAILGLDPNDRDSLDKKVIKRAYKRLALKYHPDVATNKDSTSEEKKRASDRFAKVNAAYETLSGKGGGNFASSTASTSTGSSGWTPPHRRQPGDPSYSSSSSSYSGSGGTSWEDFMPKYDDAQYDTGGDSFGSIFADLLAGAAATAGSRGGAGVVQDFVEFLERNVDGYGGVSGGSRGGGDDAELQFLLQTGTVDEVGEELDDTELVVQQLTTKLKDLQNELITIQAELAASTRFSEKIALEQQEDECNARKGVVENYLRKARKRLLALQTRYKQLIVGGGNDSKAGGRSTSQSWSSTTDTATSSSRSAGRAESSNSRRATSGDPEEAWKTEGFGSSGRGRGSSRRRTSRSSQRRGEQSTSSRTSYSSPQQNDERRTDFVSPPRTSTQQPARSASEYNVPPHRRTRPPQTQDDKERLRELKVDDEFEKLKKELGL